MHKIELSVEIEPVKPDTPAVVSTLIKEAFEDALAESQLSDASEGKPELVFKQYLPGIAETSLVVSVIQLVITADPLFFSKVKFFVNSLFSNSKMKNAASTIKKFKFSVDGKEIHAKNLSAGTSIQIISDDFELHFKDKKR